MSTISVEVVPYGADAVAEPFTAGIAIVSLDGRVVAKLRTTEGVQFTIAEPQITTTLAAGRCEADVW